MKEGYITIAEASEITAKHKDTIRRLIKTNVGSPHIVKGKKGQYLIDSYWLKSQYGLDEPHTAPTAGDNQKDDKEPSTNSDKAISAVIEALTKQQEALTKELEAKDKQIESLHVIIKDKEANTTKLQDQFQQLLASAQLPARVQSQQTYEAEAQPADPTPQENPKPKTKPKVANQTKSTATKQAKKAKPTPKKTDKKKRWWQR